MPSPFQHPQCGDLVSPPKYAVRASYTGNVANLGAASTTCDTSVTLVEGDVVLLTEQSTGSENGLYVVGPVASGIAPLTRHESCKSAAGMPPGTQVFVSEGTARGNLVYQLTTNAPVVIGTTSLTFAAISQVATAPTITDLTNAQHTHANAANGGKVAAAGVTAGTSRQVLRTNAGATASEWGAMGLVKADAPAFVTGDCAITPDPGKVYDIPTTATNSTVSITTSGLVAGDIIGFSADGTKNGHTVTYRDGATAITAAKTASKRHAVLMFFDGAKLTVFGEVSP